MDRVYREGNRADDVSFRCGSWDDMSVVFVCCFSHGTYCCVVLRGLIHCSTRWLLLLLLFLTCSGFFFTEKSERI